MTDLQRLSDVQVLLLAAQFISDVNVDSLRLLAAERADVLSERIIYRLLLTLYPTDETARSALLTLLRSTRFNFEDVSSLDGPIDAAAIADLSSGVAEAEAQHLHLNTLEALPAYPSASLFARFLVSWAHQLEAAGSSLEVVGELVQAFSYEDEDLAHWLRHIYYLSYDCSMTISTTGAIARDIEHVITPWVLGGTDANSAASWSDVYSWILSTSLKDFDAAADAFLTWNGPPNDSRLSDLAQLGFAIIYSDDAAEQQQSKTLHEIWARSTSLAGFTPIDLSNDELSVNNVSDLASGTEMSLAKTALLSKSNQLTTVSEATSQLLAGLLRTKEILSLYKVGRSIPSVAKLCLGQSAERQQHELGTILQQIPRLTTTDPDWQLLRRHLFWLHSWQPLTRARTEPTATIAYLGQLDPSEIDAQLLDAILANGQYQAAKHLYVESQNTFLSRADIEDHIIRSIYTTYDNASNGNRNRGGIKKASDALTVFKPSYPDSVELQAIEHLLKATHRLSFYQLVLQHGVPFRPVNLRAQKDPLSLVEKVLEQDPVAYSKLDDLVEVGRELVLSRPPKAGDVYGKSMDSRLLEAEQRVTFLAISSALANHDFNTAYSYITTRLLTRQSTQQPAEDDVSWRAAYAAGRYRPPSSPSALHDQISGLSKRMELLSLALTLAPSAQSLAEILGTWRRCEEEMEGLKSTALREERAFETGRAEELPGGFGFDDREWDAAETKQAQSRRTGTATYEEEAPVSLFEMARGAAGSLRKSAFPLSAGLEDRKHRSMPSQDSDERPGSAQDGDRVRKRDMVSNMVTSGLVSGMGWVLGAQPADRPGQQQQ
ncbi:Protein transport protein sec39 [Cyphellophora attinorum]|uniref:Protein transport protein sec39 n=1 Tax=Cyphellophora attinorum TaxID=1664694 RepID=A0A0N0NJU8_9EURO|nr:Protein transport protein sec39 [Phialophora attinorum]KPI37308.1 Protein transport protein sec39 [Phialophora attinorum]